MNKDYYRSLGLSFFAEDVVIRSAFKLQAHRYHPDKCPDNPVQATQKMVEINEAYQCLSDPILKDRYDKHYPFYAVDSDFYRELGVLNNADAQLINAAYQALIKKYSAANKADLLRLEAIKQAYQTLSNSGLRKLYDIKRRSQGALLLSPSRAGLSIWKLYLAYNFAFWLFIALILGGGYLINMSFYQ
ncbi:MAG: DnaJ domain-containing protein [Methylococcales bacterium]